MGVDDPRKTVGAVWFDMNDDGRLDVFTANQDGTLNGLCRNDGTRFVDVAGELGMDAAGRPANFGSNGPSVVDYDNDGRFDLFVAGYGRNFLFHNEGGGRFKEVAEAMGVAGGERATPSSWGDYDNDGRPDLYVSSYVDRPVNEHDFLYHHNGSAFSMAMPDVIRTHGATHGVVWVDFDGDGALDLSLANNNPNGGHYLFRNVMAADRARRSVQVMVVDERGRHARARRRGARVRARHSQGARRAPRRHRRRLLLAEHPAGAPGIAVGRQGRRRSDADDESGTQGDAGRERRSEQASQARAPREGLIGPYDAAFPFKTGAET